MQHPIKKKMAPVFRAAEGGLFSCVEKADVGASYQELRTPGRRSHGLGRPVHARPFHARFCGRCLREGGSPRVCRALHRPHRLPEAARRRSPRSSAVKTGSDVDPERNILITPGSDSGLFFAILPFIQPGDEVIIPSPSYPNNFLDVRIAGGVPVAVGSRPKTAISSTREALQAAITPKTKMVLLTHPNNPTTTVFNRASLEALSKIIIDNDLVLVCDQAFEDFTYGNEMITPAALPGMFERTVTVFLFLEGHGLLGFARGIYRVLRQHHGPAICHRCRRGGSDLHCGPAGSDSRASKTPAS